MPFICPIRCNPCFDDVCIGAGVCIQGGGDLVQMCPDCGHPDGPFSECECPAGPDDFCDFCYGMGGECCATMARRG